MIRFGLLLIVTCCLATGCTTADSGQEQEGLSVDNPSVRLLNHLVVECSSDDTFKGVLSVFYPSHRVLLGTVQGDSLCSGVEYEHCYHAAGYDLPPKVLGFQGVSDQLLEIPGTQKRVDGGWYGYAKRGDVVYRYDSSQKLRKSIDSLDLLLGSVDQELATSFFARAEADQFINGSWTKLTRFKFAGSMGFWIAPQDSIKLRIRLAGFEVNYFSDRVLVDGNKFSSSDDISFEILKPVSGYWPSIGRKRVVAPFFADFQSAIVANGEEFPIEFALPHRAISFSIDVFVIKDGLRQPLRLEVGFHGPAKTTPHSPNPVLNWPLVPAEMESGFEVDDLGFPGGVIFPIWAVDRLFELGRGFGACNPANREKYGDYLEGRHREKEREKERKRKAH